MSTTEIYFVEDGQAVKSVVLENSWGFVPPILDPFGGLMGPSPAKLLNACLQGKLTLEPWEWNCIYLVFQRSMVYPEDVPVIVRSLRKFYAVHRNPKHVNHLANIAEVMKGAESSVCFCHTSIGGDQWHDGEFQEHRRVGVRAFDEEVEIDVPPFPSLARSYEQFSALLGQVGEG